jgi:hypothetical protein
VKVKCPNCGLEQERHDLFCSNCGTKLAADKLRTVPMTSKMGGVTTNKLEHPGTLPVPTVKGRLNLHVIRSGQILPLSGPGEYIVGRVSEGQSILPDIDLEPYAAYESGVSRLHARIRLDNHTMWITDLGSANGTRLNNEKLTPHQDYPLSNKDMIRFGRLNIQALIGED